MMSARRLSGYRRYRLVIFLFGLSVVIAVVTPLMVEVFGELVDEVPAVTAVFLSVPRWVWVAVPAVAGLVGLMAERGMPHPVPRAIVNGLLLVFGAGLLVFYMVAMLGPYFAAMG